MKDGVTRRGPKGTTGRAANRLALEQAVMEEYYRVLDGKTGHQDKKVARAAAARLWSLTAEEAYTIIRKYTRGK